MSENTDETLGTNVYNIVYNHCKIYNIPIYFCNIDIKQLQHISRTPETLETYICNMLFQCKHPCPISFALLDAVAEGQK